MLTEKISVAICTFNRAERLRALLGDLSQQTMPHDSWELIVINNNSTDSTAEVVTAFQGKMPLLHVIETEQGSSAARNRAMNEYTGDVIVFLDDDVRVGPGFLQSYADAFKCYADAGYFGGRTEVDWHDARPKGLIDINLPHLGGLLVNYDLGPEDLRYEYHHLHPYSANCAVRRGTIDAIGHMDTSLGIFGERNGRGEDAEYFLRADKAGIKGMYIASAVASHWFDENRLKFSYLMNFGAEKHNAHIVLNGFVEQQSGTGLVVFALMAYLRGLRQLLKGRRDRYIQSLINMGMFIQRFRNLNQR